MRGNVKPRVPKHAPVGSEEITIQVKSCVIVCSIEVEKLVGGQVCDFWFAQILFQQPIFPLNPAALAVLGAEKGIRDLSCSLEVPLHVSWNLSGDPLVWVICYRIFPCRKLC